MSTPVKSKRGRVESLQPRMAWILAAPSSQDLIRLLSAWKLWVVAGLVAAALGATVYFLAPPPFRARATVNVDFHMEQAWPQNTDREQFYYLERETRKLIEIAQSDATLTEVAGAVPGLTVQQLRAGAAQVSQPGNGGWHFFGLDRDPQRASMIASSWASAFAGHVEQQVAHAEPGGLESFITADATQTESLEAQRSVSVGTYMLAALLILLPLGALGLLMIHPRP